MKPLAQAGIAAFLVTILASLASGQSMLPTYPGYDQAQAMQRETRGGPTFTSGAITPTWTDGGKAFDYTLDGKSYHYDVATLHATETAAPAGGAGGRALAGDGGAAGRPRAAGGCSRHWRGRYSLSNT